MANRLIGHCSARRGGTGAQAFKIMLNRQTRPEVQNHRRAVWPRLNDKRSVSSIKPQEPVITVH
jgi:hypothetical protein